MRIKLFAAVLSILLVTLAASGASAQAFVLGETIEFATSNFTDRQFLLGQADDGEDITVSAALRLPDGSKDRPVIVLLHGSDGPQSLALGSWRDFLTDKGFATLRIDSYTARGIGSISNDQGAISQFTQVYDAYRAVELLAADGRVDAQRVVLLGLSRGGSAVLYAAMRRFHDAYGPANGAIVAYLSFYPPCNIELDQRLDLVDAPIRHFHGSLDNWSAAAVCSDYIKALQTAGSDVQSSIFEGAHHAFDNPMARAGFSDPSSQASLNCMRKEVDGVLINTETGVEFSYDDACVTYGPLAKYDEHATAAARVSVLELLNSL